MVHPTPPSHLRLRSEQTKRFVSCGEEPQAEFQARFRYVIVGSLIEVMVSLWTKDVGEVHRLRVFLLWRSTSCLRFFSQYSGVILIGSPEFIPSRSSTSSFSSALRFWSPRTSARTYSLGVLKPSAFTCSST